MSVWISSGRRRKRASLHDSTPETSTDTRKRPAGRARLPCGNDAGTGVPRTGASAVCIDRLELETCGRRVPMEHLHRLEREIGEIGPEHRQLLQQLRRDRDDVAADLVRL